MPRRALAHDTPVAAVRLLLVALFVFDVGLGVVTAGFPELYLELIHPRGDELHPGRPTHLVVRTGILWLVFAVVQGAAALDPTGRPWLVVVVAALRLMDVPADLVYGAVADDLGLLGRAALLFAPAFNLAAGVLLVTWRPVRAFATRAPPGEEGGGATSASSRRP